MDNIDFSNIDESGEEVSRRVAVTPAFNQEVQATEAPVAAKTAPVAAAEPTNGIWSVTNDQVPVLPDLHPLERTAVFVPNVTSPDGISQRISGLLRDRSIEAVFEDAKAKCTTQDGVDFRIRLYRGRGDYKTGVIVEVQRRFGISTYFHNDTMAILDRAKGNAVSRSNQKKSSNLPLVSEAGDDFKPNGAQSLAMVAKMLKPLGHDSQYLGLQTLCSLTDGSKMGNSTSRAIAKELFVPGNEVGSKVWTILAAPQDQDDMYKLRSLSFQVLANALTAVHGEVTTEIGKQMESILVSELQNAEQNQRTAFQAARCAEWLLSSGAILGTNFAAALETAAKVGSVRHAGLEQQAKKCLDKI